MPQVDDLSCSLVAFDQDATLIVVVEMSEASWLVAGMAPGVDRQPLKKLGPDPDALLRLVERWRDEAVKAGKMIERIALAFEAWRDGFWLARWLQARGIEVHVIHSTSVAVSREHRRAKTDRLDTAMLMRVFLGWLRSERGHCGMVAIPTLEDEDARRPSRERESLVGERTRIIPGEAKMTTYYWSAACSNSRTPIKQPTPFVEGVPIGKKIYTQRAHWPSVRLREEFVHAARRWWPSTVPWLSPGWQVRRCGRRLHSRAMASRHEFLFALCRAGDRILSPQPPT